MKNKNKTYRTADMKILRAVRRLFERTGFFRVMMREVAREASVADATAYRHYNGLANLIGKQQEEIRARIDEILNKNKLRSVEILIQSLLLECYKDREALGVVLATSNMRGLEQVTRSLKPAVVRNWPKYNKKYEDSIYKYCSWMVWGEIFVWRTERYSKDKMDEHAKKIVWIIKNAPRIYRSMVLGVK